MNSATEQREGLAGANDAGSSISKGGVGLWWGGTESFISGLT